MPTFRKGPIRAKFWDYSDPGRYFITVITAGRQPIPGEILNGKMILSHIGEIVEEEWYKSFDIRKELFCDIFQMMPDHLHAIVRIECVVIEGVHNPVPDVGAHGRARLHQVQGEPLKFGVAYRSPKSISSFMVGFKSAPTKRINEFRQTPGLKVWQPRFHDRIIRNEQEFQKKFKYIQKNPRNWTEG
jgi:REP element-mobilizing transposase RayT